jgi:hypothetical protein
MAIAFGTTDTEFSLISKIADRVQAMEMNRPPRLRRDRMSIVMDFAAVQNGSTPLDLQRLLDADDFNFAHDAFGIERHLDRDDASPTACELLNCFLPRCTKKSALQAAA